MGSPDQRKKQKNRNMPKGRNKNKEPKQRQIESDDDLSASGPEVSDEESEEEELHETEVMRVQGRSDSEDDDIDDEYEAKREYATASKDAFGKNEFIGTDLTEKKRRKLKRDEKREIAELEEKDADERRADLMNLIGGDEDDEESSSDDDEAHDNNVPTVDEGEMTKEEKIKLVKRQSPELFPLIAELKLYKGEMDDLLVPLTNIFTDEDDPKFVAFIKHRLDVCRAYCVNIAFYLRLRAKATPNLNDHPVMGRLAQLRTRIAELTSKKTQDFAAALLEMSETERQQRIQQQSEATDDVEASEDEDDEAMADFVELTQGGARKRPVLNDDDDTDEDDEDEDGKRKITYKMQKNKGFIPKRQKKRRNPRVKHRIAYAEAVKRRKGAVREVKKETTKYAGEASGIKIGLKKSVRTKY